MLHLNHQQHHQPAAALQQQQQQQQQRDHIRELLMGLAQRIQVNEETLEESRERQEQFVLKLQERATILTNINYLEQHMSTDLIRQERARHELAAVESFLRQLATKIDKIRLQMLTEHKEIFDQLSELQREVLFEHLPRWHLDQQLANNGVQRETHSLDRIQSWVELLADISWRLRMQLISMHTLTTASPVIPFAHEQEMNCLGLRLNKSLEALILNTFVVEKQPPQVMKTNTRFTSTVRYLCGHRLNVHMSKPLVKVSILSEHNARAIRQRQHEILLSNWSYLQEPPAANQPPANVSPADQQQQQGMPIVESQQQRPSAIYQPNQQQQQQQQQPVHDDPSFLMDTPQPAHALHYMDTSGAEVSSSTVLPAPQQQFFQRQQQQQQQAQQQYHTIHPHEVAPPKIPQRVQYLYSNNAHHHHQHQQQQQQQQHQHHLHTCSTSNKINIDEFDPSGEILNNSNQLEFQESTGQLVCHFRNMQLKKIKRTEKKGTESVMDEKFILVFHLEFRIAEPYQTTNQAQSPWFHHQGTLSFHIIALSLPVVVIVHGNQDPHAWATVTWHNAFARQDELLYQVPDKVDWRELGRVLSDKFRSYAGKGLNEQNLSYLMSKISRSKLENEEDIVSWNQFAKEPLPEMSFTFWEWFHSILKLTKDHLRELWNADRIYGFVDKKGCVDLLLGSTYQEPMPVGTFLLRYSETELGGISIAWVSSSQTSNNNNNFIQVWQRNSPTNVSTNVIMHLQPFLGKDLQTRSLADRIRDLNDLTILYPNLLKDEAFGAHYTPINAVDPLTNGYIRPMLIQTLVANYPKTSGAGSISENTITPATPNSNSQSSPDGIYQDNTFMNDLDSNYSAYDPVV